MVPLLTLTFLAGCGIFHFVSLLCSLLIRRCGTGLLFLLLGFWLVLGGRRGCLFFAVVLVVMFVVKVRLLFILLFVLKPLSKLAYVEKFFRH